MSTERGGVRGAGADDVPEPVVPGTAGTAPDAGGPARAAADAARAAAERASGRRWALAPVALLGLCFATQGLMLHGASRANVQVVPDYYQRALRWDEEAAARRAAAQERTPAAGAPAAGTPAAPADPSRAAVDRP